MRIEPQSYSHLHLLQRSSQYEDYITASIGGYPVLYSPTINTMLYDTPLTLQRICALYELPEPLSTWHNDILATAFPTLILSEQKMRLVTDLTKQGLSAEDPLLVQPTEYTYSLCTNELACATIYADHPTRRVWKGQSLIEQNEVIYNLADSPCSNHIGVSTLAITSDGYLILPVQGAQSLQSPLQYVPSGSGSIDWSDAGIIAAMERELSEECGIPQDAMTTHLVGYARLLHRGGKPEWYGYTRLSIPRENITVPQSESGYIDQLTYLATGTSPGSICTALQQDRASSHQRSIALRLNIQFLCAGIGEYMI